MHRSGIAIGFALVFACSVPGCTGKSDGGGDAPERRVDDPQPNDATAPPVEPIDQPPTFALVEITPITPSPHTVVWRSIEVRARDVQGDPDGIELIDLHAGVLGRGIDSGGHYQIVDGRLEPIDFISQYHRSPIGVWPDDAWSISETHDESKRTTWVRLLKAVDGKEWVAQPYAGEARFLRTNHGFRKSTRAQGGMLVTKDGVTERLAGSGPPPVVGSYHGELVDFIEARAGKVYVISKEGRNFNVVVDCADQACVREKSRSLPLTFWDFSRHVTRDGEAVSMLAKTGGRDAGREFVLDVGPTGWALSEFPGGSFTLGMWASEDGGLWVRVQSDDPLWHRDPGGTWRAIPLPESIDRIAVITAAVTPDGKELWIAGSSSQLDPLVFVTHANAQEGASPATD